MDFGAKSKSVHKFANVWPEYGLYKGREQIKITFQSALRRDLFFFFTKGSRFCGKFDSLSELTTSANSNECSLKVNCVEFEHRDTRKT